MNKFNLNRVHQTGKGTRGFSLLQLEGENPTKDFSTVLSLECVSKHKEVCLMSLLLLTLMKCITSSS